MKNLNIEIGKTYNYFDDGKIKESRKSPVIITHIIPFNKIGKRILKQWEEEAEDCDWLYEKETDFFIKGDLYVTETQIEKIVFVRASRNGWFSLGWWGGSLDVDGSLTKISDGYLEEYNKIKNI